MTVGLTQNQCFVGYYRIGTAMHRADRLKPYRRCLHYLRVATVSVTTVVVFVVGDAEVVVLGIVEVGVVVL